jgi:hemerythrin-like domain-containing protein
MRRHEALAELSRDHHQALACALVMKRARPESAADTAAAFLAFWRAHGAKHFRIEEEILLPAFARHHDPHDEVVTRVLAEHVEIRRDAQRIEGGPCDAALLNDLGTRLDAHVSHEERTLFPIVERELPEGELIELARAIAAAESG